MKKTVYRGLVLTSLLGLGVSSQFTFPSVVEASDKGTFIVGDSVINVRRSPSTSGEKVATYQPGDKINYDEIVVNEGYRWISYMGASGNRNYVAIGTADGSASYGTLSGASSTNASVNNSTNSSTEIARIAGEWQSGNGFIITIEKDGRITPSTNAVVSWDGTKFVASQVTEFDYNETTDVITYNELGMGGFVNGYGMSDEEYKEAVREFEENQLKIKTFHRVGSNSEVTTQSEEAKEEEKSVTNEPTQAEKELIAKVWNQLGAKQYSYYVYRRPAGTPVNYYDGVGENYPEVTYLLAEDSDNPYALTKEVLFSDNGDGTITLYKFIKHWHFSPDKFEEATKDHLADTEIVKLEDISSSEQEAMLQLVTKYEGFENSEKASADETNDSQSDKDAESKTASSSQKETTTSSSSSDSEQSETKTETSSSSTSTQKSDSSSSNNSKGNIAQRVYKTITNRKTLPSTGESVSVLGGVGVLLLGAVVYLVKKRK